MIVTNSNLKGVNGRRYLVCDLSSKHLDDFKYYANLREKCFNVIVGKNLWQQTPFIANL